MSSGILCVFVKYMFEEYAMNCNFQQYKEKKTKTYTMFDKKLTIKVKYLI